MSKVKITVIKRTVNQDLIDKYVTDGLKEKGFGLCQAFEDGQEFVIENAPRMPEGFCNWAWADIQRDVAAMLFGADYPWVKHPGTAITCCTDGFRPVIFEVERIET